MITLQLDLPEPISESERDRRLAEQRLEPIPVAEAAWLLVDHGLDDGELDDDQARQEARIRQATKGGELAVARGRVRMGDLMDWAGRDVTVIPEWGIEAQVLPDRHEDYIAGVNRFRKQVFAALAPARAPSVQEAPDWEQLMAAMLGAVASGLGESWGVVLALDAALASSAEDLDGEPVVHTETVIQLEEVRQRILENAERLREERVELELPSEPDAEFLRMLQRRIVD